MGKREINDTDYTTWPKCPYCGFEDSDAWEWNDAHDTTAVDCAMCGREYWYIKEISVHYSTWTREERLIGEIINLETARRKITSAMSPRFALQSLISLEILTASGVRENCERLAFDKYCTLDQATRIVDKVEEWCRANGLMEKRCEQ